MTHKEMTAHIRNRLKAQRIPARVRLYTACGTRYIQVNTVAYEARWSDEERRAIAICADVNGLTGAQGGKIDPELEAQLSHRQAFDFEYRANPTGAR